MTRTLYRKKLCFVTSQDFPRLTESDQIAAAALGSRGALVVPAVWNDPSVGWEGFDAIIIRSPWDYHLDPVRFADWLGSLQDRKLVVYNPVEVLRWNMNKRYLAELRSCGILIPRTYFLERNQPIDISAIKSCVVADAVVIKPEISASSWNTWRCSLGKFNGSDHARLSQLLESSNMIVQEYMPEVPAEGELSMIFFGERFSHAVRKYPASGDFRVQEELGGRYVLESGLSAEIISRAAKALTVVRMPLLYARVDGVFHHGEFVLMEMELLEPSLYFDAQPAAAELFCDRFENLAAALE